MSVKKEGFTLEEAYDIYRRDAGLEADEVLEIAAQQATLPPERNIFRLKVKIPKLGTAKLQLDRS